MEDVSAQAGPENLESQLVALKSSSTKLRIEALRKLQHAIQGSKDGKDSLNRSKLKD
jgi:hypothetical protein